jgi:hypothetical protein
VTVLDAGAHKWKRELLVQRVRDLNDVPFVVDGVTHYGGGADDLIAEAIRAVEADDLVVAERCCEEAERKSLRRYDV